MPLLQLFSVGLRVIFPRFDRLYHVRQFYIRPIGLDILIEVIGLLEATVERSPLLHTLLNHFLLSICENAVIARAKFLQNHGLWLPTGGIRLIDLL